MNVRRLNYVIGTAFGVGYAPLAPGTAGSLLALVVIYLCSPVSPGLLLAAMVILFLLGVYSGGAVEKERGEDPQIVVIDEVVGMGVSLLFLPRDWRLFLLAFLLFRLFDIRKPPPINASQRLPGGWGIMMDDVIAGVYALIVVQAVYRVLF